MKLKQSNPQILVLGNEKGGAGKTTCAMHIIASALAKNYKVASIDVDSRQHTLTTYLQNRVTYNKSNNKPVAIPQHYLVKESDASSIMGRESEERTSFLTTLSLAQNYADIIIIDTPGSYSFLSRLAHSYADIIITPINDSFLDIDVLAKINPSTFEIISPSIYSQMVWQQKIAKSERENKSIEWIVLRNRLSNIDAINKRKVAETIAKLAKRISFKQARGFSERVIYRELFLQGLTLLDLEQSEHEFKISHIAARQELKELIDFLGI